MGDEMKQLIKNAIVFYNSQFIKKDILIDDGIIADISDFIAPECADYLNVLILSIILTIIMFFPVLQMCTCICVSRAFLIKKQLKQELLRLLTVVIHPFAQCLI